MPVAYRDYYETLGVPRGASSDEIRRAYRELARENHPDVNSDPAAEERFREIAEAYEVLRDPEKRVRYDRLGSSWRAGDDVSGAEGFGGFARGRDGGTGGFQDFRVDFGDASGFGGFSDLFEEMFGGRGRGGFGFRPGSAARAPQLEAEVDLSLEEALGGGRRWLRLPDGRSVDVEIPRGVRDGTRVRVADEDAGDLILRIRLRPHPRFRLEGDDLHTELPVSPWEAALGATVELRTLDGRAQVKVPPGSSCGRRLRLRGEGMARTGGRGRGDLYAQVKILVPRQLSRDERTAFERLAEVSSFDPRAEL
jgi:curved DNA-binding protein